MKKSLYPLLMASIISIPSTTLAMEQAQLPQENRRTHCQQIVESLTNMGLEDARKFPQTSSIHEICDLIYHHELDGTDTTRTTYGYFCSDAKGQEIAARSTHLKAASLELAFREAQDEVEAAQIAERGAQGLFNLLSMEAANPQDLLTQAQTETFDYKECLTQERVRLGVPEIEAEIKQLDHALSEANKGYQALRAKLEKAHSIGMQGITLEMERFHSGTLCPLEMARRKASSRLTEARWAAEEETVLAQKAFEQSLPQKLLCAQKFLHAAQETLLAATAKLQGTQAQFEAFNGEREAYTSNLVKLNRAETMEYLLKCWQYASDVKVRESGNNPEYSKRWGIYADVLSGYLKNYIKAHADAYSWGVPANLRAAFEQAGG